MAQRLNSEFKSLFHLDRLALVSRNLYISQNRVHNGPLLVNGSLKNHQSDDSKPKFLRNNLSLVSAWILYFTYRNPDFLREQEEKQKLTPTFNTFFKRIVIDFLERGREKKETSM